MRFILVCVYIVFLCIGLKKVSAQAQDEYWLFGDSAGIHFTNDTVEPFDQGALVSVEACASISDVNGNLLFYTEGLNVWNRAHQIMENGTGLMTGSAYPGLGSSSTNGVTIIDSPKADSLFYIFTVGTFDTIGLRYSEVDISQNNGLGKVTSLKNVLVVQDTLCEKVSAVKHGNGRDWWIIGRSLRLWSNRFYKALVTPEGVLGSFVQDIGTMNSVWFMYFGEATFSPSGNKYVFVSPFGQIDLFDFDRCSGELFNFRSIGTNDSTNLNFYGASFSGGESRLYVSNFDTLFQFDLTASDIKQSKTAVWIETDPNFFILQHQIGPDGRIYISSGYAIQPNDTVHVKNKNLTVINNPDSLGAACNVSPYSIPIGQGRTYGGLPNNPNYALGPLVGSACDTLGLSTDKSVMPFLKVIPNPSNGKFKIEMPDAAVCEHIWVIDVAGRKVWDQETLGIMKEVEMDLARLAEGTYYLEVECVDGKVLRSKFMIQR